MKPESNGDYTAKYRRRGLLVMIWVIVFGVVSLMSIGFALGVLFSKCH